MSGPIRQAVDQRLRASALRAFAAALLAAGVLAWAARFVLPVSDRFPLVVSLIFGGGMLLAIGGLRGGHPFACFGAANQITTFRGVLAVLVAGLVAEPSLPALAATAAAAALVVTLLDGIDGWLARRTHMSSEFGARFDMEVDAFLILVLAILAWRHGKAGSWILLAGLLRYLFIVAGRFWAWMSRPLRPSLRRQTICVVQIVGLIVALVPSVPPPASTAVAALALTALCYSFLVDTMWLWRNAS
jgi:phosphatidylglycerophosphate synthase